MSSGESFWVRREKLTGDGEEPALVSHAHDPWAAAVGTTKRLLERQAPQSG